VRAALVVAERELLQAKDAPAAPRQLERRSAAHAAEAEDNDIVT